ncbi:uncharacterized protein VICG_01428, partial [Vittaforma corneae ATCC 50505]
ITDESFLTGEAVPICKGIGSIVYSGTKVIKSTSSSVSLNNTKLEKLVRVKNLTKKSEIPGYSFSIASSHSVFDDIALGIVIKIGKQTRRNKLMCSLAVKKPSNNELNEKSIEVVKYLILGAVFLMLSFIVYFLPRIPLATNLEFSVDVALTFFSPALYTCLQIGAQ